MNKPYVGELNKIGKRRDIRSYANALQAYYRDFNTWPTTTGDDERGNDLGAFVDMIRQQYKKQVISKTTKKLLDQIHFDWNPRGDSIEDWWMKKYQEVKKYVEQNGAFPRSTKGHYEPLARWISHQRAMYKDGRLQDWQIAKLKDIGFEFTASKSKEKLWFDKKTGRFVDTWTKHYYAYCTYLKQNGHPPRTKAESPSIYTWARKQGKHYKLHQLNDEQKELLRCVDFANTPFCKSPNIHCSPERIRIIK